MVGRAAAIQIVALTVILAGAAWQPVRAEDTATQHASNGATCARSTFRVLIDVGHTATSPGADSARGVPEYVFNLKLADVIAQSLHDAGFDETVRLITPSLFPMTMQIAPGAWPSATRWGKNCRSAAYTIRRTTRLH